MDISPGSRIALVGVSGSGKSTFARLLLGLYQPSAGRIFFDGTDLRELDVRTVRAQLGVVLQASHLFTGTIRENIALSDPSLRLERVMEAARLACIHDDIMAMPMGYETLLADAGGSLSGGQRQRLALARALCREPAVLLLDEATSALDAVTEKRVQTSLYGLTCTRIIIAHRLSTIIDCDQILVLEDGQIIESGKHHALVALGGRYAELVSSQLKNI